MIKSSKPCMNRRQFLQGLGGAGLVAATGSVFMLPGNVLAMANSEGFLLVDLKKCQGCGACMTICALAHSGVASQSLARIQIQQDPFESWPDDIFMAICLQCQDAPCVEVCPVSAIKPAPDHANARIVDPESCIGCLQCVKACPYAPKRIQYNPYSHKAQKCDLCRDTPYLGESGGPEGTLSCMKVCPVSAIAFTRKMPDQKDESSYNANLRNEGWASLGYTDK